MAACTWDGVGCEGCSTFIVEKTPSHGPGKGSGNGSGCVNGGGWGNGGGHGNGRPSSDTGHFPWKCNYFGWKGHKKSELHKHMANELNHLATDKDVHPGKSKDVKFLQHVLTLTHEDNDEDDMLMRRLLKQLK